MSASKLCTALLACLVLATDTRADHPPLIRSRQSGAWSDGSTWEGGIAPTSGAKVQVRAGHAVVYDVNSDRAIRSIHVAGTLRFATDRDTRLDVGLIKIQPGDDASENGFDCDAHAVPDAHDAQRPALEVGTAERPIESGHVARIRLVVFDGMDPQSCPAIACCGGRMDFHGAPMPRTWVKLGQATKPGDTTVMLAEPVPGWREGDRLIVTAGRHHDRKEKTTLRPGTNAVPAFTEERTVRAIEGASLTFDRPLAEMHSGTEGIRGEVANLSRNVIVESADPERGRGHTMYHRNSSGSIAYAEFRHLGKEGVKGRYPIHFHMVGQTMRGSSVVGASIWDSGNRWITIHGTNDLVVRDCVGYRSVGHGFFLEDGTETRNVFDRNLAVQAFAGKPLPDQELGFDDNAGAGFWWANSRNTFTRNVAVECDRYGFRYEATASAADDLKKRVLMPGGRRERVDIRTLPFIRFDDNEAHNQLYGVNLGEGTSGVGPDRDHPFVMRNTRLWDCFWAFRPEVPEMSVEGLTIERSQYGIFLAQGDGHAFRDVTMRSTFAAGPAPEGEPRAIRDESPPTTIVTFISESRDGKRIVRGTSADAGTILRVVVNGREARALVPDFSQWEVQVDDPGDGVVTARSEDAAGNIEGDPHRVVLGSRR